MVRGEIFHFRGFRGERGHEQHGQRYAVIVQSDDLPTASTLLVVPTSASAPKRTYRPSIDLDGRRTRLLVEQLTTVSADRLGRSAGRLSATEMRDLDDALKLVLAL